jgi:hypothetical protein
MVWDPVAWHRDKLETTGKRGDGEALLARAVAEHKKVVFVTGAGLSAASGVPTFR